MPVLASVAAVAASIANGGIRLKYCSLASPRGSQHTGNAVLIRPLRVDTDRSWCSVLKLDDGREHIAKWAKLFGTDASIGQEQFNSRLSTLEFDMPAGPAETLCSSVQAFPTQVRAQCLSW